MSLTKNLPYQPLNQDDSHPDHHIPNAKPSTKITKILFSKRSKKPEQIRKERPRILHQISPGGELSVTYRKKGPERDKKVLNTIANLKQFKFLEIFSIEMERLVILHDQDLNLLIKSLNRIKIKGRPIFLVCPMRSINAEELDRFCRVIRQINNKLKREIMLYLPEWVKLDYKKLLGTLVKLKHFTEAYLQFSLLESTEIYELMDILKTSRFLSHLSIVLDSKFSDAPELRELFDNLRRIKSLKFVKLDFRWCCGLKYSTLKELQPVLKDALQIFDIAIVFDNTDEDKVDVSSDRMAFLYEFEWQRFVKSIKEINSPHSCRVKLVSKFRPRYELLVDWAPLTLALVALVIFVLIRFI